MTQEDFYILINEYDGLLKTIRKAISQKELILKSALNRYEVANELSVLSEEIRNKFVNTKIYINKSYLIDFVKGKAVTIDPFNDGVKAKLSYEDDSDSYVEIRCDFWGPCNDFLYFMSPIKIVVVDEEAYVLKGEYEELRNGSRNYLGGHKQNEDFPSSISLEARTHNNAVEFCRKLIDNIKNVDNSADDIMRNHLCILENNYFPALALGKSVSSNQSNVSKWSNLFSEVLRNLIEFYEPDIVLGQRDNLGYCCPEYSGIFNQALGGLEIFRQVENKNQSLLGRKIEVAERVKTGRNKCGAIIDECGTIWIGYTYFSRNNWSGYKGDNIITWIKERKH